MDHHASQSTNALQHLLTLLVRGNADKWTVILSSDEEKESWESTITHVATLLKVSSPKARENNVQVSWNSEEIAGNLAAVHTALKVLRSLFSTNAAIFCESREMLMETAAKLLRLCWHFEQWALVGDLPEQSQYNPIKMKKDIYDTIEIMLHVITSTSRSKIPDTLVAFTLKTWRDVIAECLDICDELIAQLDAPQTPSLAMFFEKPRLQVATNAKMAISSERNLGLLFETEFEMHCLLAFLLKTVSVLIDSQAFCHAFMADMVERLMSCANTVIERCFPTFMYSNLVEEVKAYIRLVISINALQRIPQFPTSVRNLQYRLLLYRVERRFGFAWGDIDPLLKELFSSNNASLPSGSELGVLLNCLQDIKDEEPTLQGIVVQYFKGCIHHSDYYLIKLLQNGLSVADLAALQHSLTEDIDLAIKRLTKKPKAPVSENMHETAPSTERSQIQQLVNELVAPDKIVWGDEDITCVSQLKSKVIRYLQAKLERKHVGVNEDRFLLARRLRVLVCLMSSCDGSNCLQLQCQNTPWLKLYLGFCRLLLDETTQDVTARSKREVYVTLEYAIKHYVGEDDEIVQLVIDQVFEGLVEENRGVRLATGRGLSALMQTYARISPAKCNYLINRLWAIMNDEIDDRKETILMDMKSMLSISEPKILARLIHLVTMQIGVDNPVISASALLNLVAVENIHGQKLSVLVQPILPEFAKDLIQHNHYQHKIEAFCKLAHVSTAHFLSNILPYIVPFIFSSCDYAALEYVTNETCATTVELFINYRYLILAAIFLLPKNTDTAKGLNFILKVINSDRVDIVSIVTSCLDAIIAELVISMGDDEELGVQALTYVYGIVKSRLWNEDNIGATQKADMVKALLRTRPLGLITAIDEKIQKIGTNKLINRKTIIRSLSCLFDYLESAVAEIAPLIMATLQTFITLPECTEETLRTWFRFLAVLGPDEVGPYVAPTTAAMVTNWPSFSPVSREEAKKSFQYLVNDIGTELGKYLDDIVDISAIHDLFDVFTRLKELRDPSLSAELKRILNGSSSYYATVVLLSLRELKAFMLENRPDFMEKLMHGDIFDHQLGNILAVIIAAASQDSDDFESVRPVAYECLGILGAVDPDRCEIPWKDSTMVVVNNFSDEDESIEFAINFICDHLLIAFRATSDTQYQLQLAFTMQELLRFCNFSNSLLRNGPSGSVPVKTRNRWKKLPNQIADAISPFLSGRFKIKEPPLPSRPSTVFYASESTYRDWIRTWVEYLIYEASGDMAKQIFVSFRGLAKCKDLAIPFSLLPHLVLNILISGQNTGAVREEILAVMNDQVNDDSTSSPEKKLLSAQAIFMLLDHINRWIRNVRQKLQKMKKKENKRSRLDTHPLEEQLVRVDSTLSSIDQILMAKAAYQCRAYARSLMSYEQQILVLKERSPVPDLTKYYERLHEIYAQLDEPDGMEGISTLIFSPSLEHTIRQHESTGKWTSAQSCWELRLQQSPDDLNFHIGLLRCLRNLGHYDTLRTHIRGVLTRKPEWERELAGFHIESAWVVGAWDDVQHILQRNDTQTSPMALARVLLSVREGNKPKMVQALSQAWSILGAPITAVGATGYKRGYDAALQLHLLHELEHIYTNISPLPADPQRMSTQRRRCILSDLSHTLSVRLEITQPNFRSREPILSMRRTIFSLLSSEQRPFDTEIGRAWLSSAKIARKACHWQTAYSAVLQAQQVKARLSFIESAKLTYASEDPLHALHELENAMKLLGMLDNDNVLDLTVDDESLKLKAKAHVLRARWMGESDRYEAMSIVNAFATAVQLQFQSEKAHYYSGGFQDAAYKSLPEADKISRGLKMHLQTVKSYAKSIKFGSKYIYETIPRLLTIWLDSGEDKEMARTDIFRKLNDVVAKSIKETPAYKWYTAFPQIVSRMELTNPEVYKHLSALIFKVIEAYPQQALWLFISAVKSTKVARERRGKEIFSRLKSNPRESRGLLAQLINQSLNITNELLGLCDAPVGDVKSDISMSRQFSRLFKLGHNDLIIPLRESLTATLPPTSDSESAFQPFPIDPPTFAGFEDTITVMNSLAKPRKITIIGSDGKSYPFLGKPRDDLRKDAKLMELFTIINKLLKADSESRRRQLRIRTYGVVTLNEECGFIQWVANTCPVRTVLLQCYENHQIRSWSADMGNATTKMKTADDKEAARIFQEDVLPKYPPVFHEWFIETFPEPTAWLSSRLAYARTTAVMSMVGFIVGLGDRHSENILLDDLTGDLLHVDLNCLFDKGKAFETPERVPFRLTQNIVDGLGVTGVEGVFRIGCELTVDILRANKDTLMSVLDAFIHDPLVEWEDEKRKLDRQGARLTRQGHNGPNPVKASTDLVMLAKNALLPIGKKFRGIYATGKERREKEMTTTNLVEALIQEASDPSNLAKMYVGWTAWF